MLKISYQPEIILTTLEEKIFHVIREVCRSIPQLSGGKMPITTARICGGWVRDRLLGKQSYDLDIALDNMTGEQFAQFLVSYAQIQGISGIKLAASMQAKPEQSKHLAVSIIIMFGQKIDLMNLRKEEYEPGNRIPKMVFGNAYEDSFRRDLTINTLFYRIDNGQIEDFTGLGLKDLKANPMMLRTPLDPKMTFLQDPLRVLRVLRFYSRYSNSVISPKTLEAMRDEEIQELITKRLYNPKETKGITAERIADEFKKMMKSPSPEKPIEILFSIGLGQKIFALPEEFDPEGWSMNQKNEHHTLNILEHSITALKSTNRIAMKKGYSNTTRMMLNIASLFHDVGKINPAYQQIKPDYSRSYHGHEAGSSELAQRFSSALKLSNHEMKTINSLVREHMRPHQLLDASSPATLRRFKRQHTSPVDYSELKEKLKDPDLSPEEKADIQDEIKSLRETENMWDLLLTLSAGDASAKEKELEQDKITPYLHMQSQLESMPVIQQGLKSTDLLNGNQIMEVFAPSGLKPSSGYINSVKEEINNLKDENPDLTPEAALQWLNNNKQMFIDKFHSSI